MIYVISMSAVLVILGQAAFLYFALHLIFKGFSSIEGEKIGLERDRLAFEKAKRSDDLKREKMWVASLSKQPAEEGLLPIESELDLTDHLEKRT